MQCKEILISGIILLTFGCANSNEHSNAESPINLNTITIVLQNGCGSQSAHSQDSIRPRLVFSYLDDHLINHEYVSNTNLFCDTIVIQTERKYFELIHQHRLHDRLSFIFEQGDSVVFTYLNGVPTPNIINRTIRPHDLDYELIKRKLVVIDTLPAVVRSFRPTLPKRSYFASFDAGKFFAQFSRDVATDFEVERKRERELLDSLHKNQFLSDDIYEFYQDKWKHSYLYLFGESRKIWESKNIQGEQDFNKILDYNMDSLIYFRYQRPILYNYINKKIGAAPKIRSTNGIHPDYRIKHDSLIALKLKGRAKDMLLLHTIENIVRYFSARDIQSYLNRFEKDVSDTTLVNYLKSKYSLDFGLSLQLVLKTLERKTFAFDQLLRQNRGKVIYVDFWASWCAPCIRAFPASKQLQETYENKDVVFVYLSIDEDFEKWKRASNRHGLDKKADSYIIHNQYTSRLLEDLQFNSIPRYLLFDKRGKLVHKNAPGPGSGNAIRKLLSSYLAME